MLRQRVITAVLLLAVLLPAMAARSLWPLALIGAAIVGAGGWEWARLNGSRQPVLAGLLLVLLGAALARVGLGWQAAHFTASAPLPVAPSALWWCLSGAWVLGLVRVLGGGVARWPAWPQGLRLLLGAPMLWAAGLALLTARAQGLAFLVSLLALVWVADIAAYFGGRRFGRRKLAPTISPGKSWEGVWSGALGVALLATAWIAADRLLGAAGPSYYTVLLERHGPLVLALALALLTALSVSGDLFESLVKRSAGVKDSSGLLPGHGGVLDRIDALLPVLPVALALVT